MPLSRGPAFLRIVILSEAKNPREGLTTPASLGCFVESMNRLSSSMTRE